MDIFAILWQLLLRLIANLALAIYAELPIWITDKISAALGKEPPSKKSKPQQAILFEPACGNQPIDLGAQRLIISSAFGTYFTGLLEKEKGYVPLAGQIETPLSAKQSGFDGIQALYWALQNPKGPYVMAIAAEGGMGKSTLAAKMVRCLFEQNAIDILVGDSAKNREVNPVSGKVSDSESAFCDAPTFLKRICEQLGVPYQEKYSGNDNLVATIRDRLMGRRAVIVADNLETISDDPEFLRVVKNLAARDTRVIITTRKADPLSKNMSGIFLVHLKPIKSYEQAREFLTWHIQTYSHEFPDLNSLEPDLQNKKHIQTLVERTGGVPLLMQLVSCDVTRHSWDYLKRLPQIFGRDLLEFLYRERWSELGQMGMQGMMAKNLLHFVKDEQYRGRKITIARIVQWSDENNWKLPANVPLQLLTERFLLVNNDREKGNFAIFPSLAEFLIGQSR